MPETGLRILWYMQKYQQPEQEACVDTTLRTLEQIDTYT